MLDCHTVPTMTTSAGVLTAQEGARQGVPRVLRQLMAYSGVTGGQLARAFGMSRQAMSLRITGKQRFGADEIAGLAACFGVPVQVFYLSPDEALRWVIDHPQAVAEAVKSMVAAKGAYIISTAA